MTSSNSPYVNSAGRPLLRRSIAGFIDMLGFSNMSVTNCDPDSMRQLLDRIATAIDDSRKYARETITEYDHPSADSKLAVKFFSDNLVFGYPLDLPDDDAAMATAFVLRCVQRYQLRMALSGFFLRGALTEGSLCLTDDIVFGPTLVESYQLESRTAIVPRVLLTEPLQQVILNYCQTSQNKLAAGVTEMICRDIDGWWFINYLAAAIGPDGLNWDYVQQHKQSILASLSGTTRHEVLPKYGCAGTTTCSATGTTPTPAMSMSIESTAPTSSRR